jgi:hypothetical protein
MSIISAHKSTKKDIDNVLIRCLRTNNTYGNKFMPIGRKDTKGDYYFVLGSGKENRFVTLLGCPRPYEKEGKITESSKYSMGISSDNELETKFIQNIDNELIKEINNRQKELCPDSKDVKDKYQITLFEQNGYAPMLYVKYNVDQSKTYLWTGQDKKASCIDFKDIRNGDKAMVILKLDRVTIHKDRMKLDCVVKDIYINREDNTEFL